LSLASKCSNSIFIIIINNNKSNGYV
jgi:hypothetical protein